MKKTIVTLLLLAATGAQAAWTTAGDVLAGSTSLLLSSAFIDEPSNLSGTGAVDIGLVESTAGVAFYALDLSPAEYATEGSAAVQSFAVAAGQTLTFDWSFSTQETVYEDHAFVVIDGQVLTLATRSAGGAASFSQTFTQTGTVNLAFGVVDTSDVLGVSTLAIDAFQISPVPEPAGAALLLAGLAGLAGLRWAARRSPAFAGLKRAGPGLLLTGPIGPSR